MLWSQPNEPIAFRTDLRHFSIETNLIATCEIGSFCDPKMWSSRLLVRCVKQQNAIVNVRGCRYRRCSLFVCACTWNSIVEPQTLGNTTQRRSINERKGKQLNNYCTHFGNKWWIKNAMKIWACISLPHAQSPHNIIAYSFDYFLAWMFFFLYIFFCYFVINLLLKHI